MESRAKLLGHPIHLMLVVIPLGMFIGAVVFDGLCLWTGYSTLIRRLLEHRRRDRGRPALQPCLDSSTGWLFHQAREPSGSASCTAEAWCSSSGIRSGVVDAQHGGDISGDISPTAGIFLLEVAALLVGGVSGWLGGELVDRLAVGVDDGAHLNAPSSLSGLPANQTVGGPSQHRRVS